MTSSANNPGTATFSGHHHSIPVTRAVLPPCHCHPDTATPVSVPKALPPSLGTASLVTVPRYCLPSSLSPEHFHPFSLSPGHLPPPSLSPRHCHPPWALPPRCHTPQGIPTLPYHCHPWALPLTPIPVPHHCPLLLSPILSRAQGTSVTAVLVPVPWTPASLRAPASAARARPPAMPVTVPRAPSGPSASTGW